MACNCKRKSFIIWLCTRFTQSFILFLSGRAPTMQNQAFWRALSIARVCTWCAALVISVVVAWLLYQQNFLNQVAKVSAEPVFQQHVLAGVR